MSYDVTLKDPVTGEVARVEKHSEGGTYAMFGTYEASLSITYNYSKNFSKIPVKEPWDDRGESRSDFSVRWLYGKTARETTGTLLAVVMLLGTTRDPDYWAATDGNAGYAAKLLLDWAIQHPDAVWEGE